MKKVAIAVFFLMGTAFVSTAQEKDPQKPQRINKLVKIETNQEKINPVEQEIKNLEYQLEALDNKEAIIRQDPEETRIATAQGWFEKTEATRAQIRARIDELKKK